MLNPLVSFPTNQGKLARGATNPCRHPPGHKSQRPPMVGLSGGWAEEKSVSPTDDRPQLANHREELQKTKDKFNLNSIEKESKQA